MFPKSLVKSSRVSDCLGFECEAWVSDSRIAALEVEVEVSWSCTDLPGDCEVGEEPRKLHLDLREARREAPLTSGQHM